MILSLFFQKMQRNNRLISIFDDDVNYSRILE
jgi:hypothetical protein